MENYYGPVGVVYYRLMAAWAKERDLPPSVTLDFKKLSVTEGFPAFPAASWLHGFALSAAVRRPFRRRYAAVRNNCRRQK